MTDSVAQALACIDYGSTFPLTYRLGCARGQGLLQLRCDLAARRPGLALLTGRGFWRYAAILPIPDPSHRVTLGEGETPYVNCRPSLRRMIEEWLAGAAART